MGSFFDILKPVQQKRQRIPISLQDTKDREMRRPFQEGHIVKLKKFSDKHIGSPIVITVKKEGSIKMPLASREINKQIQKNK